MPHGSGGGEGLNSRVAVKLFLHLTFDPQPHFMMYVEPENPRGSSEGNLKANWTNHMLVITPIPPKAQLPSRARR